MYNANFALLLLNILKYEFYILINLFKRHAQTQLTKEEEERLSKTYIFKIFKRLLPQTFIIKLTQRHLYQKVFKKVLSKIINNKKLCNKIVIKFKASDICTYVI